MSLPYRALPNGNKIAPFKNENIRPYGAFANTTDPKKAPRYNIKQTVMIDGKQRTFNWPSSEHAYHAQKILRFKQNLAAANLTGSPHPVQATLTKMLDKIENANYKLLPRSDISIPGKPTYDEIVNEYLPQFSSTTINGRLINDKAAFDVACDADRGNKKRIDFMREVVRMKLAQHENLKEIAMECARKGIVPVEISQHDKFWAAGKNGDGHNMLGLIILEEGNRLLKLETGQTPAIANPQQYYKDYIKGAALAHAGLADRLDPTKSSHGWKQLPARPESSPKNSTLGLGAGDVSGNYHPAPSRQLSKVDLRAKKIIDKLTDEHDYKQQEGYKFTDPKGGKYTIKNANTIQIDEPNQHSFAAAVKHIKVALLEQGLDPTTVPVWFKSDDPAEARAMQKAFEDAGFENINNRSPRQQPTMPLLPVTPSKNDSSIMPQTL